MNKKEILKYGLIILGMIALLLIFWNSIEVMLADMIHDNKLHKYTCEDLPSLQVVEMALAANKDFVAQIENINPGAIEVHVGNYKECPDRADINIYFPGHSDRVKIEEMIESELLFGIPYRMTNY